MRRTQLVVATVLLGGVAAASLLYVNNPITSKHDEISSLSTSSQRSYWIERFTAVGPESAYAEFKNMYLTDPLAGHTAAHLFGDTLYRALGHNAFIVCDDALGYGCLHQVVANLLVDRGTASVVELEEQCKEKFRNDQRFCVHGIGHGIAEYYRGDLHLALEQCLRLAFESNQYHCAAGVFMESLVPFSGRDDAVMIPTISAGIYTPCDSMASLKFKSTCFYSLPHWWFANHQSPEQVIRYCSELPAELRLQCASGVGVDLPGAVGYERTLINKTCGAFKSPADQVACHSSSEESLRSLGLE